MGNLQTTKVINKGYYYTLGSYIQSSIKSFLKYDYSPIKIYPNMTNISTQIFQEKAQEIIKKTAVTMLELFKFTRMKNGCSWVFSRFPFDRILDKSICTVPPKNIFL